MPKKKDDRDSRIMQDTAAIMDGERVMKKLDLKGLEGLDEDRELGRMSLQFPRTDLMCTGWSDTAQKLNGFMMLSEAQTFPTTTYNVETGGVDKSIKSTAARFTLILTDLDAPSKDEPLSREFIHSVVTDLAADDLKDGVTPDTGNHIVPYVGPAPPYNSGDHRYVLLLFEQPGSSDPSVLAAAFEGRGGKKSITEAHKCGLAGPIGIVGFSAEWTEAVDEIHEKMGWLPPTQFRSEKQKLAAAVPRDWRRCLPESLLRCLPAA